jgi:aryl-alcohol dehydrogenase-like predicted oxidoreductase
MTNLSRSRLGLGCMGMSEFYGSFDDAESLRVLDRAVELGILFWDTADMYGPFTNEVLVGKALKLHRKKISLATKFGFVRGENPADRGINGTPAYVASSCENSLKRLQTDVIDLYYLHRKDPDTPIEETVGAMAKLVQQGKVKQIGLSEVSVDTLRKAHAVFPISAVQSEYSLWSRDPEEGMLAACKELGIAFVAYSPLGRGFLTAQIKSPDDFEASDWRRFSPRFQGDNFTKNLQLVEQVTALAKQKNCSAAQLALAWVLAQGDFIYPIPGTKRIKYLEENAGALAIQLSAADLQQLHQVFDHTVAGDRYPEQGMAFVNV